MTTLAQVHHATLKSARNFDYRPFSMLQKGDEVPQHILDMMKRCCKISNRGHFDRRKIVGVVFDVTFATDEQRERGFGDMVEAEFIHENDKKSD